MGSSRAIAAHAYSYKHDLARRTSSMRAPGLSAAKSSPPFAAAYGTLSPSAQRASTAILLAWAGSTQPLPNSTVRLQMLAE